MGKYVLNDPDKKPVKSQRIGHVIWQNNTRRQLIYPTDFQVWGTIIVIHRSYKNMEIINHLVSNTLKHYPPKFVIYLKWN